MEGGETGVQEGKEKGGKGGLERERECERVIGLARHGVQPTPPPPPPNPHYHVNTKQVGEAVFVPATLISWGPHGARRGGEGEEEGSKGKWRGNVDGGRKGGSTGMEMKEIGKCVRKRSGKTS